MWKKLAGGLVATVVSLTIVSSASAMDCNRAAWIAGVAAPPATYCPTGGGTLGAGYNYYWMNICWPGHGLWRSEETYYTWGDYSRGSVKLRSYC